MNNSETNNLPRIIGVALLIFACSLVFALYSIFHSPQVGQTTNTISITTGNWQPYTGDALVKNGAVTAIVTEALERIGYSPLYQFTQWDDALNKAKMNESNSGARASFPYFKTGEREKLFYYSDSIWKISHSFYVNKNSSFGIPKNPQQLCFFSLILIKGYELPDDFRNKFSDHCYPNDANKEGVNPHIILKDNVIDALKELAQSDQPLVVVEASAVVDELIKHNKDLYNLPVIEAFRAEIPLHLIASKRNPYNLKFIKQFNKALADIDPEDIESLFKTTLSTIANQNHVVLAPITRGDQLIAYTTNQKENAIILTEGTFAVVEFWPSHYIVPEIPSNIPKEILVPVRLINGPQKGSIVYIDGRSIQLP